jgi:hypothetical protein
VCLYGDALHHVGARAELFRLHARHQRDPELVRADVSEEKITIGYARKNYGVGVKPGPRLKLDKAATKKLRAKRRPPNRR